MLRIESQGKLGRRAHIADDVASYYQNLAIDNSTKIAYQQRDCITEPNTIRSLVGGKNVGGTVHYLVHGF